MLYLNGSMVKYKFKKKFLAYTLTEVMVVIVIIGVLAALALPRFYNYVRKTYNQEATQALLSIYSAQLDFALDHDDGNPSTDDYSLDYDTLDLTFSLFKHFTLNDHPLTGTLGCDFGGADNFYLASMDAIDDPYTLYVLRNGTIICKVKDGSCDDKMCKKMGF